MILLIANFSISFLKISENASLLSKNFRNKKTLAIESLLEGQAEALTQTAISKTLEGDGLALRLCLERIAPAPKDKSVSFPLLEMRGMLWMLLKP